MVYRLFGTFLVLGAAAATGLCANFDWPQWQGRNRTAMSEERGLLPKWPQGGPPLAWRVGELGGGDSTPSIAAGRIFGMSNRGTDEVVWALSEKDGSTLWVERIGSAFQQEMSQSKEGPGSTPTVEGGAEQIAYTAPYVLIDGTYMVRADSPIRAAADVDRDGTRVAVTTGAVQVAAGVGGMLRAYAAA